MYLKLLGFYQIYNICFVALDIKKCPFVAVVLKNGWYSKLLIVQTILLEKIVLTIQNLHCKEFHRHNFHVIEVHVKIDF